MIYPKIAPAIPPLVFPTRMKSDPIVVPAILNTEFITKEESTLIDKALNS